VTNKVKGVEAHGIGESLKGQVPSYLGALRLALLGGGSLVLILSSVLFLRERADLDRGTVESTGISEPGWVACWLVALLLVIVYSSLLVLRKARSEGTTFPILGLKKILSTCGLPVVIGGIVGALLAMSVTPAIGAALWAASFGLAFIAARGQAPRSIVILGWVMLSAGLTALAYSWSDGAHPLPLFGVPEHLESPMLEADLIMGACFGLIPVLFGFFSMRAYVRPRRTEGAD